MSIDLVGTHHHIGQTSDFNLQTRYRSKVFNKMGFKYIPISLNKGGGESYMNPYLEIFSHFPNNLETNSEAAH